LGSVVGGNTLTATSSGLTGSPLTFTATGTVRVATQIAINAGNGQNVTVGTAVLTAPSVIVRDILNNSVSGVMVMFAVATGSGSVIGENATTNASGIATVGSWTLGAIAGGNTLTATSLGLTELPETFASGVATVGGWDLGATAGANMQMTTSAGLTGSPVTFTATGTLSPLMASMQVEGAAVPGGLLTIRMTITNSSGGGASAGIAITIPAGLRVLSCSYPTGTCVFGAVPVTWTGTIPGNSSVTISYLVQASALATSGTQYQLTSTINVFPGPSTTVTISASPVGPGDPVGLVLGQAAGQKPGSVLIYNLYSSGFNPTTNDSRISITNTSPSRRAYVHFFFIDGSNCSVADMTITLTANQTTSFLASDFDPGVTGYLIAVATDANGCPAIQNDLIGESLVKLESGHRATLPALGVSALGLGGPMCDPNATTATLAFDGLSYNALPRILAVSGLSSIANGYSSLLVVNRVGGNLGTGVETQGTGAGRQGLLFGLLYDDQEASQSFTLTSIVCQLRGVLGNNFPRTVPRYSTVIPAGRTGWMRFAAVADEAITGALLVEAQNGLGGGHNLHHLTTTSSATLTIPVYPAR
jgi:hypothetical protein